MRSTGQNCIKTKATPKAARMPRMIFFSEANYSPHLLVYKYALMSRASPSVKSRSGIAVDGLISWGDISQRIRLSAVFGTTPAI